MTLAALAQKTVFDDGSRIALRLPLGAVADAAHPGGCFPLVEDPRLAARALVIGMMVLRPADRAWQAPAAHGALAAAVAASGDWCSHVDGIGGSWPLSGSNAVDAFRLALQYGVVDAVMAGAATIAGEGVASAAARGHLWQPYVPLSWPSLSPQRSELEGAIAGVRRDWQRLGVLSPRRYPAQVAITSGREPAPGRRDVLDARIFHESHPDGSAIEAWLLTSEAGEDRLRRRARAKGLAIEDRLLVASPAGRPDELDVAAVPALLRRRLDARVVEHDGGAVSLSSFLVAGAVHQLNLTLMGGRAVREVIAASTRLSEEERGRILEDWPRRPQRFPLPDGTFPASWRPVYAVAEAATQGEALMVSFDVRESAAA